LKNIAPIRQTIPTTMMGLRSDIYCRKGWCITGSASVGPVAFSVGDSITPLPQQKAERHGPDQNDQQASQARNSAASAHRDSA
jgi:hypothetical protein